MSTINISLPARLRSFVDERVVEGGYGSSSAYIRELIRHDRDRQLLRGLLLEGGESVPTVTADRPYFEALHCRVRRHSPE
ncbi:ribbon-helix-helix domain-containing protein [Candidatus Palauibacter sp.]|uniref:ribbon-helix-helix domain-containing protein n=1 Tax=Candidatus Palauibacter sp. TaxID=3101350 RepID=UPI003B02315F